MTAQAIKYIFIGITNYAIGYLVFVLLFDLFGIYLHYNLILLLAFLITVPVNHLNQRYFVWESKKPYFSELLKFVIANVPIISFNLLLLPFFVSVLRLPILETQFVLGGGIVLATYLTHKLWTFK